MQRNVLQVFNLIGSLLSTEFTPKINLATGINLVAEVTVSETLVEVLNFD
jgi:hypothetical protein